MARTSGRGRQQIVAVIDFWKEAGARGKWFVKDAGFDHELGEPGRIFISLAIVVSFDQAFSYARLHLLSGVPVSALYGGWIAKELRAFSASC